MSIDDYIAVAKTHRNLSATELVEFALERGEGTLAANHALVVNTGKRTGRSPRDRFIVCDAITEHTLAWGATNQPLSNEVFATLWQRAWEHLRAQRYYFTGDLAVGADPQYAVPVTVVTEYAWQQLFAQIMFINPTAAPSNTKADRELWTVLSVPNMHTSVADGVNSDAAIILNFTERCILICGTHYAGEIKKAMFTVLNFLLPAEQVLPMHCAANMGQDGKLALFFGLSGTGKTTLSSDPDRLLLGDDEHGWSDHGVFNFEGGCYAKCINLSAVHEPLIWQAIRYGAVLENVVLAPDTQEVIYSDHSITENTRAAYPRVHIAQHCPANAGPTPSVAIFLCCDLYGVLPAVAQLTPLQAVYYFLSGYTAMLGSTEVGSTAEIKPTFSTCFGAPFFPRSPLEYADLLLAKLLHCGTTVYLINTGWRGGSYTDAGQRFAIPVTRNIVNAVLSGQLEQVSYEQIPVFNLAVPKAVPGLETVSWDPSRDWHAQVDYITVAKGLAGKFHENFARNFSTAAADIRHAGPELSV